VFSSPIYVVYLKGKDHLRDLVRLGWEDNIKVDLKEVGWECVECIHVAQKSD
jgi:hypothetical protein